MATVSRRKGVFAFAKQSAAGSAASAPTFALPKSSGGIKPTQDFGDLPYTSDGGQRWGRFKQRAKAAGTVGLLPNPEALGLLLYEAMGAQSATGTAPTSHPFTMADTIPFDNPLTVWDLVGDEWWKFTDVYISKLTLNGASGENTGLELDLIGYNFAPVSAPTYTLLEPEPRFKFEAGVSKLEADSATPVTVTNVENVQLVIDRQLEERYGMSLTPVEVIPERVIDFSVGLTYDTTGNNQGLDYLRAATLGAVAGTGPSQVMVKGSFEITFGRHPVSAGRLLKIASNGANWDYGVERPDSDAGGGPVEFDVAGPVVRPSGGGTEVTVTLANDTAGTY